MKVLVPSPFLGTRWLTFAVFQHFIVQISHMMVGRCNKYLKEKDRMLLNKTVVGHLKAVFIFRQTLLFSNIKYRHAILCMHTYHYRVNPNHVFIERLEMFHRTVKLPTFHYCILNQLDTSGHCT